MKGRRKLGLALGGGAARGWAHIGVLRALHEAGFAPDVVAGTSIGALVGAAYAAGELDRFEPWVRSLGMREVISLLDVSWGGGMLKGERVMEFFRRNFVDRPIESLNLPFGAVATALRTGAEVWLQQGSTVDAVRASIALPGLFTPVRRDGLTLVDGGLVNPVPVSLARAMGADVVIAVDLNADLLGRHLRRDPRSDNAFNHPAQDDTPSGTEALGALSPLSDPMTAEEAADLPPSRLAEWRRRLQNGLAAILPSAAAEPPLPSMTEVVTASINIMQVRITRSRMAGDPPDVTITPRLGQLGWMEFHRADEAIIAGHRAVAGALPALGELLMDGGL